MAVTKQRLTFEDWLAMPDDGRQYELLNGELVAMTPPTTNHQLLVIALALWMGPAHQGGRGFILPGPVAVLLDASMRHENAPQPDLVFILREHERIMTATVVEGVPDLVVEILSPSNKDDCLPCGEKWDIYQRHDVPYYWLVDPDARTVTQYEHRGGRFVEVAQARRGDLLRSPLLPGVTFAVRDLFAIMRP